jgi:hypothetical protein
MIVEVIKHLSPGPISTFHSFYRRDEENSIITEIQQIDSEGNIFIESVQNFWEDRQFEVPRSESL